MREMFEVIPRLYWIAAEPEGKTYEADKPYWEQEADALTETQEETLDFLDLAGGLAKLLRLAARFLQRRMGWREFVNWLGVMKRRVEPLERLAQGPGRTSRTTRGGSRQKPTGIA